MTGVKITYMPSLAAWFGTNATNPGNYFFFNFNNNWAIVSLPTWSFDISNITSAGDYFFAQFNSSHWSLTSLPAWSFNISNITTVGNDFFRTFNNSWQITSLPTWSFDTSHVTTAWNYFFYHRQVFSWTYKREQADRKGDAIMNEKDI